MRRILTRHRCTLSWVYQRGFWVTSTTVTTKRLTWNKWCTALRTDTVWCNHYKVLPLSHRLYICRAQGIRRLTVMQPPDCQAAQAIILCSILPNNRTIIPKYMKVPEVQFLLCLL